MSNYVIWLDSEKAHIFNLTSKGIVKTNLEKKLNQNHTHNKDHGHENSAEEKYFHMLAESLKDAEEVLIMGPGLAKNHFKTHLEKHHHEALGKKIIGTENSDHPTDNQIVATSRKFFHKYDLFHHPIS